MGIESFVDSSCSCSIGGYGICDMVQKIIVFIVVCVLIYLALLRDD